MNATSGEEGAVESVRVWLVGMEEGCDHVHLLLLMERHPEHCGCLRNLAHDVARRWFHLFVSVVWMMESDLAAAARIERALVVSVSVSVQGRRAVQDIARAALETLHARTERRVPAS